MNERAVGGALGNLGIMFAEQGQSEQAAVHYRRALAILEKAFGPDHVALTNAMGNLAIVLGAMGQYEEAGAYDRRVLAIREKALGPEHPLVAYSLDSLGLLLVKQDRPEEALPYHVRALRIREQALGPEHPLVSEPTPLVELAKAYLARNRPGEALAAAERALALRSGTEGVAPAERAETQFVLARALVAAGKAGGNDRQRAIELARQSRATFETLPPAAVTRELDAIDAWLRRYERP